MLKGVFEHFADPVGDEGGLEDAAVAAHGEGPFGEGEIVADGDFYGEGAVFVGGEDGVFGPLLFALEGDLAAGDDGAGANRFVRRDAEGIVDEGLLEL